MLKVEEKQMLVNNLTQDREEKEIIRMKEMEMLMNLRSVLIMAEDPDSRGEISTKN